MATTDPFTERLIGSIIELLDIPPSYYEKAKERYQSLGRWMHREESTLRDLSPDVYPQGSFRYGTVIRPLFDNDEYDLDLVCAVDLSKSEVSQREVKHLLGDEVKGYAKANSFKDPASEKKRCWRLDYQDGVKFHMDILPAVPQDEAHIELLIEQRGVATELALLSVGITDIKHPTYEQVDPNWFSSNPRGFGRWFEGIARPAAHGRLQALVENRAYASTEDVPPYEWKTPLQRSIQILKRHRDVMFQEDRTLAPISMIITTLAARSYRGETDTYEALTKILDRMPEYVKPTLPRIENPVNKAEDFADAWRTNSSLEDNFWAWHTQAKQDVAALSRQDVNRADTMVQNSLNLKLTANQMDALESLAVAVAPAVVTKPQPTVIKSAPEPWKEVR